MLENLNLPYRFMTGWEKLVADCHASGYRAQLCLDQTTRQFYVVVEGKIKVYLTPNGVMVHCPNATAQDRMLVNRLRNAVVNIDHMGYEFVA